VFAQQSRDFRRDGKEKEVYMLYPQGKIIHENLSAEYTDVPQLLSTLGNSGFSGVVEIEAQGKRGAFFIASGRLVNAAVGVDSNTPAMVGDVAAKELFLLARQPQGLLHVAELPAAEIEFATGSFSSELVFKDLSTDFIRMDQFVKKLCDEKHTGYIEMFSKQGAAIGTLTFRKGDTVGLKLIAGNGNKSVYEGEAVPSALEYAVRNGAIFNVYRTIEVSIAMAGDVSGETQPAQPEVKKEPEMSFESPVVPEETPVIVMSEPEPEPGAFLETLADQIAQAAQEIQAGTSTVPSEKKEDSSVNQRGEFIADLQRVLAKLESFTDHIGKKGDFQRILRQMCTEKSDSYHFLDPFEGQFEYDSGKIRIDDDVSSEDFAMGTAMCLSVMLTKLHKEYLKGAAFPPGLKGEIESAFRYYKDDIKNSGMQSIVPSNMR
jgi:hypothetical protein